LATQAEKKKKKERSLGRIINVWSRCLNISFVVVCGLKWKKETWPMHVSSQIDLKVGH